MSLIDKSLWMVGSVFTLIECCEVLIFVGTVEYIIIAVEFLSVKLTGTSLKKKYLKPHTNYLDWIQRAMFRWAAQLARIDVELTNMKDSTEDRDGPNVYMFTHVSFLDGMLSRNLPLIEVADAPSKSTSWERIACLRSPSSASASGRAATS